MINLNGTLHQETENILSINNRGYSYGDALFETMKVVHGKILFWEDHYFRLMASMRILRMEIPMDFTMEFLESEILKTIEANQLSKSSARIRYNVHRKVGGRYSPDTNLIDYNIVVEPLNNDFYTLNQNAYTVELFKDYFVAPGLLSTLKTNNKVINVLGSVYAKENGYDNCLLLNTNKNVVEGLQGNLFLVKDNIIKTPPLEDGCLKGIMRKQIMELIKSMDEFELEEASISPFELQKADELFLTNVISGIQPITAYRKKYYTSDVPKKLIGKLNVKIRLG
ncbi:aminotransferase class IV [Subsaxibacter sp. CAU 1640]|uniref:aminotransferase class IV n=1 Tax=Subsaxibacter sp. CAU 1640 TaxID=2933271 RepID=UPI0020068EF9|nr:aminotransferase class IV [Subsaxibacter sp. CAU 1640]MCK7591269.1 aminotransferase class IV [Subsaxibacter sp. CAU 1640]